MSGYKEAYHQALRALEDRTAERNSLEHQSQVLRGVIDAQAEAFDQAHLRANGLAEIVAGQKLVIRNLREQVSTLTENRDQALQHVMRGQEVHSGTCKELEAAHQEIQTLTDEFKGSVDYLFKLLREKRCLDSKLRVARAVIKHQQEEMAVLSRTSYLLCVECKAADRQVDQLIKAYCDLLRQRAAVWLTPAPKDPVEAA